MSRISVTNSSSTKAIFSTSSNFCPTSTGLTQYHLTVTSLCRGHYLRNNKRGGLKNIRCFPECLPAGHHSKGFCGHRITAKCNSGRPLPNGTILIGCFVTWDDKRNIADAVSFQVGDEIKISELAKNTRTKDDPLQDYIASEKFDGKKNTTVSTHQTLFHFSPTSWHYGWRSSKHTKKQRHCFRVVLLVPKKELEKSTPCIKNSPLKSSKNMSLLNEYDGGDFSNAQKLRVIYDCADTDDDLNMVGADDIMVCVAVSQTSSFTISSSKRSKEGQQPRQQHLTKSIGKCEEMRKTKEIKKRKKLQKNLIKVKLAKQARLSAEANVSSTFKLNSNSADCSNVEPARNLRLQIAIDSLLNKGLTTSKLKKSVLASKIAYNKEKQKERSLKQSNKLKLPVENNCKGGKGNEFSFDNEDDNASFFQISSASSKAKYERSNSMLTLPSDSEHDDDVYVEYDPVLEISQLDFIQDTINNESNNNNAVKKIEEKEDGEKYNCIDSDFQFTSKGERKPSINSITSSILEASIFFSGMRQSPNFDGFDEIMDF